jgi:hypothetical protein
MSLTPDQIRSLSYGYLCPVSGKTLEQTLQDAAVLGAESERERCAAVVMEYVKAADDDDLALEFQSCAWAIRSAA